METKLTDFTSEELTVLILEVTEQWEKAIEMRVRAASVWGENHERVAFWAKREDILQRWLVQLRSAQMIVMHREIIQSN